jgi:hypothetical protein
LIDNKGRRKSREEWGRVERRWKTRSKGWRGLEMGGGEG